MAEYSASSPCCPMLMLYVCVWPELPTKTSVFDDLGMRRSNRKWHLDASVISHLHKFVYSTRWEFLAFYCQTAKARKEEVWYNNLFDMLRWSIPCSQKLLVEVDSLILWSEYRHQKKCFISCKVLWHGVFCVSLGSIETNTMRCFTKSTSSRTLGGFPSIMYRWDHQRAQNAPEKLIKVISDVTFPYMLR